MAINHHVELVDATSSNEKYYVLSANICYVRPLIINKPLSLTNYIGTNGGFFQPEYNDAYHIPPKDGCSISWKKNSTNNHTTHCSQEYLDEGNLAPNRGTIYIYEDNDGYLKQRAGIMRVRNSGNIITRYPTMDIVAMIGGGSLCLQETESYWESILEDEGFTEQFYFPWDIVARTGLGYKYDSNTGITTAYLVISKNTSSLSDLRNFFKTDLGCDDAIHLDGSGSSCMQYKDADNNDAITYVSDNTDIPGRYIWNMIQITNTQ